MVWRSPRRLWQGFWRRFCRIWMSGGGACWWGRRLSCWVVAAGPRWRSCRGCLVRRWPRAPTRSRRGLRCLGGNGRRVGAPNRRWRLSPVCSRLWMRWWTHRLGGRRCRRCVGLRNRPTSWPTSWSVRGTGCRRNWCDVCYIRWDTASRRRPNRKRARRIRTATPSSRSGVEAVSHLEYFV